MDERWPKVAKEFGKLVSMSDACIIAGGAIRDHVNDRQIKDFDIYIYGPTSDCCNHVLKNYHKVSSGDYLDSGLEVYDHNALDIQVMHIYNGSVDSNQLLMGWCQKNFDLDICKIYYTYETGIVSYPEFNRVFKHGECNVDTNVTNEERLNRISIKYPEIIFRQV